MIPVADMDDYDSGKVNYTRKQMDVLVRFSSRARASTAIERSLSVTRPLFHSKGYASGITCDTTRRKAWSRFACSF